MYNFDKVKILVVDDEELIREILVETFSMHGAQVDAAEDGTRAFEKVKSVNYDIVMTDVRMPNGDGISLLKSINAMEVATKPKLLVCSAYSDLSDEKIKDLNILKVFNKPFDLEQLLNDVSKILAK